MNHPSKIKQYEIIEKLGDGGMAEVFLGRSAGPGGFSQQVAIKRLHPHIARSADNIKMFIHEARLIAHLSHPNIVRIYDFGETGDTYFLVMEYVEGLSLTDLLEISRLSKHPISLAIAVHIAIELLEALHYAHTAVDHQGQPLHLVHRDLSPDNVLISRQGEVKLSDFGIATSRIQEHRTQTGMTKGKILYMSPEQCYGQEIDHRSDLFSMGTLLFEITTMSRLFQSKDLPSAALAICHHPIPSPRSIKPKYPEELEAILSRALERPLEKRYQSAREMADELKRFLQKQEAHITRDDLKALVEMLQAESVLSSPHNNPLFPGITAVHTPEAAYRPFLHSLRPPSLQPDRATLPPVMFASSEDGISLSAFPPSPASLSSRPLQPRPSLLRPSLLLAIGLLFLAILSSSFLLWFLLLL